MGDRKLEAGLEVNPKSLQIEEKLCHDMHQQRDMTCVHV